MARKHVVSLKGDKDREKRYNKFAKKLDSYGAKSKMAKFKAL